MLNFRWCHTRVSVYKYMVYWYTHKEQANEMNLFVKRIDSFLIKWKRAQINVNEISDWRWQLIRHILRMSKMHRARPIDHRRFACDE